LPGAFGATVAATEGIADDEQGLAGGLINMSRQVGAALGVAVVAAVIGTGAISGGSVAPDRSAVLVTAGGAALDTATQQGRTMRHSILGESGLDVSRIAFGTWQLGGNWGPTDTAVMQRIDRIMVDATPVAGPSPESV
jgi:hypothetical protein